MRCKPHDRQLNVNNHLVTCPECRKERIVIASAVLPGLTSPTLSHGSEPHQVAERALQIADELLFLVDSE